MPRPAESAAGSASGSAAASSRGPADSGSGGSGRGDVRRAGSGRTGAGTRLVAVVGSALLRAATAALAPLVLLGGLALLLWSLTPGEAGGSAEMLSGAVVVYGSAHFLPVALAGSALTIRPLLVTALVLAVVASASGRGRPVRGRRDEALHAAVFTAAYAIVVSVIVAVGAPAGTVATAAPGTLVIAAGGSVLALGLRATAWRAWWRHRAPAWAAVGLRAARRMLIVLAAAATAVTLVALVAGLPAASEVAAASGEGIGAVLGQFLLGAALLPNAIIAGAGYLTGVGFSIGAASFSPLAVHTAPLPAIPLLAAVPERASAAAMTVGLVVAAVAAAAALAALLHLRTRSERLAAGALAVAIAAVVFALACLAARGGVAGGPWADSGVEPLAALILAATLGVPTFAVAALVGGRTTPWRAPESGSPAPGRPNPAAVAEDPAEGTQAGEIEAKANEIPDGAGDPEAEDDPAGGGAAPTGGPGPAEGDVPRGE